jgi:hypothetical protein
VVIDATFVVLVADVTAAVGAIFVTVVSVVLCSSFLPFCVCCNF